MVVLGCIARGLALYRQPTYKSHGGLMDYRQAYVDGGCNNWGQSKIKQNLISKLIPFFILTPITLIMDILT